jgi:hypothetical protein
MISKIISKKDILVIAILFFVTTLIWVGSDIYHAKVGSTITEDTSREIAPINDSFDAETINKLKSREKILLDSNLQGISTVSGQPAKTSQGGKPKL